MYFQIVLLLSVASVFGQSLSTLSPKKNPSLCLAVSDTGSAAPVKVMTCSSSDASQKWTYDSKAGTYTNGGLCLDSTSAIDGTRVVVNTCNGASSQDWSLASNGFVKNGKNNQCLDMPDGSTQSGTSIQVWTCNMLGMNDNQVWSVQATTPVPPPTDGYARCYAQPGCGGGQLGPNIGVGTCVNTPFEADVRVECAGQDFYKVGIYGANSRCGGSPANGAIVASGCHQFANGLYCTTGNACSNFKPSSGIRVTSGKHVLAFMFLAVFF